MVERLVRNVEDALASGGADCVFVATFPDCVAFQEVGDTTEWTSLSRLRLRFDARATERLSAASNISSDSREPTSSIDREPVPRGDSQLSSMLLSCPATTVTTVGRTTSKETLMSPMAGVEGSAPM